MALTEQDRKTLQVGLFLAALVLAGAIWCKFMVFPTTKQRTLKRIDEIHAEMRHLKGKKYDLQQLAGKREQIEALAMQIRKAAKRLPDRPDAPTFYTTLVKILGTTGVKYRKVRPLAQRPHDLYTEIPYTIEAQSAFHEFGQFLNLIEENPDRFMRVSRIDITNDRNRPTIHPVSLEVTTFMLHNVPK